MNRNRLEAKSRIINKQISKFAFRDSDSNRDDDDLSDSRKGKRVRFNDDEIDSQRIRVSRRGRDSEQSPQRDAPKTSEYAYFIKVMHGLRASSLHKENMRLKSVKANFVSKETNCPAYKLKPNTDDLRFSVPGEGPEPSDYNVFVSPRISKRDRSLPIKKIEKKSACLLKNVTPFQQSPLSSLLNEPSDNSELEGIEKGLFSAKREKLRQLAHASLSEIKGSTIQTKYDLVSSLLSRLFPVDNENIYAVKNGSEGSLAIHDSGNLEKGFHLPRNRECEGSLPVACSGRSNEIASLGWNQHYKPVLGKSSREHYSFFGSPPERLRYSGDGMLDPRQFIQQSNDFDEGFHLHHKREWDVDHPVAFSGKFNEITPLRWNQHQRPLPWNFPKRALFFLSAQRLKNMDTMELLI